MSFKGRIKNYLFCSSVALIWAIIDLATPGFAQHTIHPCLQGMVQIDSVQADLAALTGPGMEGRGTGQRGYQKAADFVAAQLMSWDLLPVNRKKVGYPSFFHPVPYQRVVPEGGTFVWEGRTWTMGQDFVPTARRRTDTTILAPIYRVQSPSSTEEGKDPLSEITAGQTGFSLLLEDKISLKSSAAPTEYLQQLRKKAASMGCRQICFRPAGFAAFQKQWAEDERHRPRIRLMEKPVSPSSTSPKAGQGVTAPMQEYAVSAALFRSIRRHASKPGAAPNPQTAQVVIHNHRDSFSAPNVVGMMRGKSRPEEYIFLTAHLDHLGIVDGKVYPGADDNGSGSAVLLSVARALSQLARQNLHPDRSIVLIWFSGEENGLLGSRWMAITLADSLGIRSDQVFANINMDMLGRNDGAHEPEDPYLYVVHHHENESIRPFTEQVNTLCSGLKLDYSYSRADDPERLFTRSDHYAFHLLGIPAFFLFSGLHDDYHQPTDTADKISVPRLARNAGFVLNLAWQLAQRSDRLNATKP